MEQIYFIMFTPSSSITSQKPSCGAAEKSRGNCMIRFLNLPMAKARGFRQQSLPARRRASCWAILSRSRFAPNPWHRHNKQTAYATHSMSDWLPNLAFAKPSCGTIALATLPTITCWRYDMLDTGFFASSSLTPQLKQGDCVAPLFNDPVIYWRTWILVQQEVVKQMICTEKNCADDRSISQRA